MWWSCHECNIFQSSKLYITEVLNIDIMQECKSVTKCKFIWPAIIHICPLERYRHETCNINTNNNIYIFIHTLCNFLYLKKNGLSAYIYCISGDFCDDLIFAFFPICFKSQNFILCYFKDITDMFIEVILMCKHKHVNIHV